MLSDTQVFRRLELTVTVALIARKPGSIAGCFDAIEEHWRKGKLSLEQRFRLLAILIRAATPRSPLAMAM